MQIDKHITSNITRAVRTAQIDKFLMFMRYGLSTQEPVEIVDEFNKEFM